MPRQPLPDNIASFLRDEIAKHDVIIDRLELMMNKLAFNVTINAERQKHMQLNNIQLHYLVSIIDIQTGMKYFTVSKVMNDYVGECYFAKSLATDCCSLFESKSGMNQNKLNDVFLPKSNKETKEIGKDITANLIAIDALKVKYFNSLEAIRHKLGAHKDGSGIKQYERLQTMDIATTTIAAEEIKSVHLLLSRNVTRLEKSLQIKG